MKNEPRSKMLQEAFYSVLALHDMLFQLKIMTPGRRYRGYTRGQYRYYASRMLGIYMKKINPRKCVCRSNYKSKDYDDEYPYRHTYKTNAWFDKWTERLTDIEISKCYECNMAHYHIHCQLVFLLLSLNIRPQQPDSL